MRSVIVKTLFLFYAWLPGILASHAQPVSKNVTDKREKYFNKIYRLIDKNFYYRSGLNDRSYFKDYKQRFLEAPNNDKAYTVLKEMMSSLEGRHCGFLTPAEVDSLSNPATPVFPSGKIIGNNIAMVQLPACMLSQELSLAYVDTMQQVLGRLDRHQPGGWIIDLRKNYGGITAAMFAAIGTFFPDGAIYYFDDRRGKRTVAKIENGAFREFRDDKLVYSFTPVHPAEGNLRNVPVAILIGNQTASAAEIVAIAFKSVPRSRSFGQQTVGLPVGNVSFVMDDKAVVYITRSILTDLQGMKYTDPVQPDVPVPDNSDSAVVDRAVNWILNAGTPAGR
jgi:C-terminal processing protease CtpA/Prc